MKVTHTTAKVGAAIPSATCPRWALGSRCLGEAALYGRGVRRRLGIKRGITGLWQVNGRSDLSWDESVPLDLRYMENWSFVLDLHILWKTGSAADAAEPERTGPLRLDCLR